MAYKDTRTYADRAEYQREYQRRWKQKNREEAFALLGPCRRCGSWLFLHLHHVNPLTKVSHRIWTWSKARRAEELKKCFVLCCTHHRKEHANNVELQKALRLIKEINRC